MATASSRRHAPKLSLSTEKGKDLKSIARGLGHLSVTLNRSRTPVIEN